MTLSSGRSCTCGEEASYYLDFEPGTIVGVRRYACAACADMVREAPEVDVRAVKALPSMVEVKEAQP